MLVIIPGWMHDSAQWSVVCDLLTSRNIEHGVIAIPGFGTVTADPNIATMDDLSQWCLQQITNVQSTSATPLVLFGHSCGGRVALQLVAEGLPVQQLILCGSPNLYRQSSKAKCIAWLVALATPLKPLLPEWIKSKVRSDDYAVARGSVMQTLYASVVQSDQSTLLPLVTTQTRLLWGAQDSAAPLHNARELHERLVNSTLEVIPQAGHNLHHDKPHLLAAKIASYVTT
jgi:pimeloyl-ACP methyl ester carboxylesterase